MSRHLFAVEGSGLTDPFAAGLLGAHVEFALAWVLIALLLGVDLLIERYGFDALLQGPTARRALGSLLCGGRGGDLLRAVRHGRADFHLFPVLTVNILFSLYVFASYRRGFMLFSNQNGVPHTLVFLPSLRSGEGLGVRSVCGGTSFRMVAGKCDDR